MSIEKPSPEGNVDKGFLDKVPHTALQERILTLGRENDLFLMLKIEPGYGERNQNLYTIDIAKGLYQDPDFRDMFFPEEEVESEDDVGSFLRGDSQQAVTLKEYIPLAINYQLDQETKIKKDYLKEYAKGRFRGAALERIKEIESIVTSKEELLSEEDKEEKKKYLKMDFAPVLKAELISFLEEASFLGVIKYFLEKMGVKKVDDEISHFIEKGVNNEIISEEITSLLAQIQEIRKKMRKDGDKRVRKETKNLTFKALGPRLEGEKEKTARRKKRSTMQGYLLKKDPPLETEYDGIPFLDVDEFLEEDIETYEKPIPAVKDAPAKKTPELKPFKIPTPPPPVPVKGRLDADEPKLSGPIPASSVFDEIEQREQSGSMSVPDPNPIIGDDIPVLDLDDDEPDTVVVDMHSDSGHKNVIVPGELTAEDVKAAQTPPQPATFDLGPVIDIYKKQDESVEEQEPEPATIDKVSQWVQKHITKIGLAVGIASIGTAGYVIYERQQNEPNKKGNKEVKVAHNTKKDDDRKIPEPPMRRLDEPVIKTQPAMKTVPVMKKAPAMKVDAVKPMAKPRPAMVQKPKVKPRPTVAPKLTVATKPRPVSKPAVTPPSKSVDVRGVASKDNAVLVAIDKKTLNDLPEGVYKGMWSGESYDVQNAPHASVSGFMQEHLHSMIKNLPTKRAQNEARRAYYSTLKKLERGWLIYMSQMEDNLMEKSMNGTLTAQEDQRLKWWEEYKKTHKSRKWQAKWLYKRYQYLQRKGKKSKSFAYYKHITEMGRELMEGLHELNPEIVDLNNVTNGQKVRFAKDGKVLETFWRFAHAMKLPMPEKGLGSTGELTPNNKVERKEMVAQHIEITDDMVVDSYSVPPVPEDAQVHNIDDSQIVEAVPMYGSAPMPELKPVLGEMIAKRKSTPPPVPESEKMHAVTDDMIVDNTPPPIPEDAKVYKLDESDIQEVPMYGAGQDPVLKPILADMDARRKAPPIPAHLRDHKPLKGKISSHDVYSEVSLERLDGGDYEDFSVKEDKPRDPMYGAAPLKKNIKPVLADMVKKSQNDYKEYSIERGTGDYDSYSISEDDLEEIEQVTPPPIPAMAEVEKVAEPKKKKSLWARAKSWLKRAV